MKKDKYLIDGIEIIILPPKPRPVGVPHSEHEGHYFLWNGDNFIYCTPYSTTCIINNAYFREHQQEIIAEHNRLNPDFQI